MESLRSCKQLFTRFGLLCMILPYFSNDYTEWNFTVRVLCVGGNQTWIENADAFKVLFRSNFHKVMRYPRDFNQHFIKFILMFYNSMYYSLEVNLSSPNSYSAFISLLETIKKEGMKLSFYAVNCRNIVNNIQEYNKICDFFRSFENLSAIKSSDEDPDFDEIKCDPKISYLQTVSKLRTIYNLFTKNKDDNIRDLPRMENLYFPKFTPEHCITNNLKTPTKLLVFDRFILDIKEYSEIYENTLIPFCEFIMIKSNPSVDKLDDCHVYEYDQEVRIKMTRSNYIDTFKDLKQKIPSGTIFGYLETLQHFPIDLSFECKFDFDYELVKKNMSLFAIQSNNILNESFDIDSCFIHADKVTIKLRDNQSIIRELEIEKLSYTNKNKEQSYYMIQVPRQNICFSFEGIKKDNSVDEIYASEVKSRINGFDTFDNTLVIILLFTDPNFDEIQINKYLKTDITQLTAKSIKCNIDKNISLFFSKLRLRALNRKKT